MRLLAQPRHPLLEIEIIAVFCRKILLCIVFFLYHKFRYSKTRYLDHCNLRDCVSCMSYPLLLSLLLLFDVSVFLARSSMSSSLGGSMGGSCLQQRAEGYPAYVFHEPLHSLTQSYSHAHSAAHSQPHRGIPTSHGGTPATPGGQPAGPGGAPYQPTTSTATGEFSSRVICCVSCLPCFQGHSPVI